MTVPADWSQLSHRRLYDAVHSGPGRAISVAAEEHWTRIEATITGIEQRISAALARSNGGWEGAAADTSRAAVSPLGAWALDAAGDARLTAGAIVSQAEHAAELRRLFPPPASDPAHGPVAGRIGRLPASPDTVAEQAAADADARRLMSSYANHSYENDRYLDYWTVPPSVTVDSAPVGPSGAGQGAGDGGAGRVAVSPGGTGAAGAGGPGSDGAGPGGVGAGGAAGFLGAGPGQGTGGGAGSGGAGPGVTGVGITAAAPGGVGSGHAGGGASGTTVPGGQVTGGVPSGSLPPGGGAGPSAGPRPPAPGQQAATGRPGDARAPTAGGRGPSRVTTPFGGGTVRPVAPAVPRSGPGPGWRDVLPDAEQQPRSDPGRAARSGSAEPPGRAGMVAEETARPAGPRGAGLSGMYPPMMGAGGGTRGGEHRRPGWLLDGTGAFDDDRWFPPAVLTPDDT